jgi:hypothetical protein
VLLRILPPGASRVLHRASPRFALRLVLLSWLACAEGGTIVPTYLANAPDALGVTRAAAPAKLSQLLGDLDREYVPPRPTLLQTQSKLGILGADLGFSFLHQGRLYFYFCDADTPDVDPARPRDADAVAYVDTFAPGQPLELKFLVDPDGRWHAVTLDGQAQGSDRGPDTGFSDGQHLWAFYYVDPTEAGGGGGVSKLARSDDGGFSFHSVLDVPSPMEFVMPRVMDTVDVPGLDSLWSDTQTLLMWGRNGVSPPILAAAPLDRVGDLSSWVYYAPYGAPQTGSAWSSRVEDASHVYTPSEDYNCRGPFSVLPLPQMQRWIMLERCARTATFLHDTVQLRVAGAMLGPWSPPITPAFFDSTLDQGLGHFIHCSPSDQDAGLCAPDPDYTPYAAGSAYSDGDFGYGDTGNTPPRETEGGSRVGMGLDVGGWPYGPFPIEPMTTWDATSSTARLYFLMSTLNPYTVMMMQADLVLQP